MRITVLGSHNLETPHTRHTCFLVDGTLGIDAGSLVTALTSEEQGKIRAILLTHGHFDHIRDLPTLGLAHLDDPRPIDVYGLPETLASVRAHLMDGVVHPDLTKQLNDAPAKYRFHAIAAGQAFNVLGYTINSVPGEHPVPEVGYIVRGPEGSCFAYTGDTRGDLTPFLRHQPSPQVLFVDVTFPDRLQWRADISGHLTPSALGNQLRAVRGAGLTLPQTVPVHLGLQYEEELVAELTREGKDLGVDLRPGRAVELSL